LYSENEREKQTEMMKNAQKANTESEESAKADTEKKRRQASFCVLKSSGGEKKTKAIGGID
jgi:hypothetical protein